MRLNTYKWYLWKWMWLLFWLGAAADKGIVYLFNTLLCQIFNPFFRPSSAPDVPGVNLNVPSTANTAPAADQDGGRDLTLEIARRLENRLKYIRNEELCVPEIQEKFDSMDFVTRPRNDEEQLQRMTAKLEAKLAKALQGEYFYFAHGMQLFS